MANAPAKLDIPKNPAERRGWIITQLWLRGTSLRAVGAAAGKSHQSMSYALRAPSAECEELIARALGLTALQLFPERFDAAGVRLHRLRPWQPNTAGRAGNVDHQEVA